MQIQKSTLDFLKKLAENNNREWFQQNKQKYEKAKENFQEFLSVVEQRMAAFDEISGSKMFRIYRDVRFSKDKTPYKTVFLGSFQRSGASRRGGYGIQMSGIGNTDVGGGFFGPEKDDLLRVRKEIELDGQAFKDVIQESKFHNTFGNILGDSLKTAPRGFDKQHSHVDLLRMKQYFFMRNFTPEEVTSKDFVDQTVETFHNLLPFFDYMSEVLTTDLNGVSILQK